jgi:RibD domain-containing protein
VSVIVIEFITLDGIVSDPDGSAGTPAGGWAFRHGPETIGGDKFQLGSTLTDTTAWASSRVIGGDLIDAVGRERRDVVITGSLSVVHALIAEDLIDEYRLLTFPTILGTGERLFPTGSPPAHLKCLSAEQAGAAVLARYGRAAR